MARKTRVTNSVRTHRFNAGQMTQAELAARCDVTRQTIIAIEQGRFTPSLETAFKIARAFNVPLDQVFEYHDD
ncbi:MAG: helix-turn-helix transcriptional regulator [Acidimicrobiia bacterium]|nr:helix-turn-helix transcriptional regulator [Acidimicrobiia bacterium]MDH3398550.1 helix-turn-helix transcriptional regulator [Acidimicrobiia bacterium]MDH5615758.1 helix-turn-helix transcriptional regulator [Acidimicrobiia bacterium]